MSRIQLHNITFTRNNLMQYLVCIGSNSSAIVNNMTILGNNVNGGVFAKSSNLGMNRVLLQSNTFAEHFIWSSFSSNVSLELMRIKENEFWGTNSIIEIKDCIGRLANTHISYQCYLDI